MLHPDRFWSNIIDGDDRLVFGLPNFIFNTKEYRGRVYKVNLVIILEHAKEESVSFLKIT